jgi:hypothetical protein
MPIPPTGRKIKNPVKRAGCIRYSTDFQSYQLRYRHPKEWEQLWEYEYNEAIMAATKAGAMLIFVFIFVFIFNCATPTLESLCKHTTTIQFLIQSLLNLFIWLLNCINAALNGSLILRNGRFINK